MPVIVTAKHCSGPMAAVERSYVAVVEHCSATGIKFTNADFYVIITLGDFSHYVSLHFIFTVKSRFIVK